MSSQRSVINESRSVNSRIARGLKKMITLSLGVLSRMNSNICALTGSNGPLIARLAARLSRADINDMPNDTTTSAIQKLNKTALADCCQSVLIHAIASFIPSNENKNKNDRIG